MFVTSVLSRANWAPRRLARRRSRTAPKTRPPDASSSTTPRWRRRRSRHGVPPRTASPREGGHRIVARRERFDFETSVRSEEGTNLGSIRSMAPRIGQSTIGKPAIGRPVPRSRTMPRRSPPASSRSTRFSFAAPHAVANGLREPIRSLRSRRSCPLRALRGKASVRRSKPLRLRDARPSRRSTETSAPSIPRPSALTTRPAMLSRAAGACGRRGGSRGRPSRAERSQVARPGAKRAWRASITSRDCTRSRSGRRHPR